VQNLTPQAEACATFDLQKPGVKIINSVLTVSSPRLIRNE
jgi:hypothetical protein